MMKLYVVVPSSFGGGCKVMSEEQYLNFAEHSTDAAWVITDEKDIRAFKSLVKSYKSVFNKNPIDRAFNDFHKVGKLRRA